MADKSPRILCLDDQPELLHLRKILLEQFGCEVVAVYKAEDCLWVATHEPVDLALVDYHLAEETTTEDVCRDLRVCVPGVPLVMLTSDPKVPESVRNCVDAVLMKGCSPQDLLCTIEHFLPDCVLRPRHSPLVPGNP